MSRAPGGTNMETARFSTTKRIAARTSRLRGDAPLVALDVLAVCLAATAVTVMHHEGAVPQGEWASLLRYLPLAITVSVGIGALNGLYGSLWQHAGVLEARRVVIAGGASLGALVVLATLLGVGLPVLVVGSAAVVTTALQGLLRFQSRLFAYRRRQASPTCTRVLVLGAGQAGAALVADMLSHPEAGVVPVGLLDDDPRKQGRQVHGVRVLGPLYDVARVAAEQDVAQVVLAITDAPQDVVALLSDLCEAAGLALRLLPTPAELVGGKVTLKDVRDLRIDDLLGRTQVATDLDAVRHLLAGKRVLITGAGGSIGSEIARQVDQCGPASLLLLDHDETHLHDTSATVSSSAKQLLCDIRQRGLLHRLFALHEPQIVFHAAAHKHVPLLEDHPAEAVKTNVHGTQNVVDAAVMVGVERFVFISTDKAVRPSSVMGATKAVGEQIVLSADEANHRFCAVRFGNVLGSRGSVIPTFVRQIQAGGPVTLTDARMTRFFMSIPEAVQLVLQAATLSEGGEVFMLEMGEPVKIMDLAQSMIRLSGRRVGTDIEIRVTGMRPGEKLAEELSSPDEVLEETSHPSIVRLVPQALDPEVLSHEVEQLVEAADNGRDSVVRSSVFAIATLRARRRRRIDLEHGTARRDEDVPASDRNEDWWTRSTR
jgi:FlaA1/EpsC-like NDP-sugar epimerase